MNFPGGTIAILSFVVLGFAAGAQAADQAKPYPVDALFAREAASMNAAELKASKHVVDHAATATVKRLAQTMVDDHTAAENQLKQIADNKNIDLPDGTDSAHDKFLDDLEAMKGADYERAYVQAMVADHAVAIALFKDEAENGNDPDLKAFAAQILPKLQAHREQALTAQHSLKGTGRARGAVQ